MSHFCTFCELEHSSKIELDLTAAVAKLESDLKEALDIIGITPYAKIKELESELAKARESRVVILTPAQCDEKIKRLELDLAERKAKVKELTDLLMSQAERNRVALARAENAEKLAEMNMGAYQDQVGVSIEMQSALAAKEKELEEARNVARLAFETGKRQAETFDALISQMREKLSLLQISRYQDFDSIGDYAAWVRMKAKEALSKSAAEPPTTSRVVDAPEGEK